MKIRLALILPALLVFVPIATVRAGSDKDPVKDGLSKLNEFIGSWKGSGKSSATKVKDWTEGGSWGWNFKEKEPSIAFESPGSQFLESGVIRYDPKKKLYSVEAKGGLFKEPATLTGKIDSKGYFVIGRTDPDTGDKQEFVFYTTNEGGFLNYRYQVTAKGRTIAAKLGEVTLKKEGFSIVGGAKRPECVVTGGLGTMPVSYNGKTYYVCCTGCRDAFNENPEKYVKAFEAKKK